MKLAFSLIAALTLTTTASSAFDISGWDQGAMDYESIVLNAKSSEAPYIVYFHAEWCPWCKRLNGEYLSTSEIQNALRDIKKVAIDPDKNPAAHKPLMQSFGAKGFPSLFIVDPLNKVNPIPFSPFYNPALSPAQFKDKINSGIGYIYASRGEEFLKQKDYSKAISAFSQACNFDNSFQNRFGLAYTFHMKGLDSKDANDLASAKVNYQKALELDPNHALAKQNLLGL